MCEKLTSMDIGRQDEQAKRLRQARETAGFSTAKAAAERFGFNYNTYSQHERGIVGITRAATDYARAFRVSEAWLLTGEGESAGREVPLMGYVGAGAEVEPDFEQVPECGLDQIMVPFPLPDDMIAFQVKGDSMLPMFDDGMVIIVFREQRRAIESFFGERAVVRTADGRRYIKTIIKGEDGRASLLSWNAQPIQNVDIAWIGEIFTYFPASAMRRETRKVDRQGGVQGRLRLRA
ncbi:MAG: hypothetical protein Rhirs2KO_09800 [Rhizobiaceae bacterium]